MALKIAGGASAIPSPDARRIQIAKRNRLMALLLEAHDMAMETGQNQMFVNTLERLHNEVSRKAPMYS